MNEFFDCVKRCFKKVIKLIIACLINIHMSFTVILLIVLRKINVLYELPQIYFNINEKKVLMLFILKSWFTHIYDFNFVESL